MAERSYEKESKKTTPSGIRFDKEQLDFVQKRESKLNTKQKVVDYLLNKYWWDQKVKLEPSHKGLPPTETSIQDLTKPTNEIKAPEQPKTNYAVNTVSEEIKPKNVPKSFSQYQLEKRQLETEEQYEKWLAEVEADQYLSSKQRNVLKTIL